MRKLHYDPRLAPESPWALRLAASVGRRQLRTMKRRGLPACLHEPLEFLLERRIRGGDYGPVDRIEALRAELARRPGIVGTYSDQATRAALRREQPRADEQDIDLRPLSDLALVSSVPALWGTFLYLCAKASGARTVVELGTAAGISGSYLGSAPSCRRFITVEGDPDRARLAEANLRQIVGRFELVTASFDAALDALLPTLQDGIDFAFIDGNKARGRYLALVDRLAPSLTPGAIVVLDDIQWSEMAADWKTLCTRPGLAFAVNAGRFGVCVWGGGAARPQAFTLYGIAGVDLYKLRRDLTNRLRRQGT